MMASKYVLSGSLTRLRPEYSGRWKVLNYGLAGIFSPVVIYPFWTAANQSLEVLVTSDRWETVNGTAQLTWYNWKGEELSTSKYTFSVPTLNNSEIFSEVGFDSLLPAGTQSSDVWLWMNLTAHTDSGTVTNEQYVSAFSGSFRDTSHA